MVSRQGIIRVRAFFIKQMLMINLLGKMENVSLKSETIDLIYRTSLASQLIPLGNSFRNDRGYIVLWFACIGFELVTCAMLFLISHTGGN